MYQKFEIAIKQLQGRAEFKNDILERKLAVFQRDLERKEMTLRELVQRSGLDQATVDNICKNMEEAIEAKNSILRNLKYSLAHAIKAYNDAIRVYEAKLLEFGIPADELGIEPLVTNTSTMPAGLVAAWACNAALNSNNITEYNQLKVDNRNITHFEQEIRIGCFWVVYLFKEKLQDKKLKLIRNSHLYYPVAVTEHLYIYFHCLILKELLASNFAAQ